VQPHISANGKSDENLKIVCVWRETKPIPLCATVSTANHQQEWELHLTINDLKNDKAVTNTSHPPPLH